MSTNEQTLLMIGVILAVVPLTLAVLSDLYEGYIDRKKEKQQPKEEHCSCCGGCCDELCGCQACVLECECECECHNH